MASSAIFRLKRPVFYSSPFHSTSGFYSLSHSGHLTSQPDQLFKWDQIWKSFSGIYIENQIDNIYCFSSRCERANIIAIKSLRSVQESNLYEEIFSEDTNHSLTEQSGSSNQQNILSRPRRYPLRLPRYHKYSSLMSIDADAFFFSFMARDYCLILYCTGRRLDIFRDVATSWINLFTKKNICELQEPV